MGMGDTGRETDRKKNVKTTSKSLKALTGVALLVGLGRAKRSVLCSILVRFPIRAHAWVVGSVPGPARSRGNQSVFLALFLPPVPFLKIK